VRQLQRPLLAQQQKRAFAMLTGSIAKTSFGREFGIRAGMTYEEFKRQVSPRSYEPLSPYIDAMRGGSSDVLWPGKCNAFVTSAGTTGGEPRVLPLTDALVEHFRRAWLDSLYLLAARHRRARVFAGPHLFLGTSGGVAQTSAQGNAAATGELSSMLTRKLRSGSTRRFCEPADEISTLTVWPEKLQKLADRARVIDPRLIIGAPSTLRGFAQALTARDPSAAGEVRATVSDSCRQLSTVVHAGQPLAPFADELKTLYGAQVDFHEVHLASEGLFAAQDGASEDGLLLLADTGIFFEFAPLSDYEEGRLSQLNTRAVPAEQAKPDVDYVMIVTTPAGLCRYVSGDIVRFKSTAPARITPMGQVRLQLNAFGERVLERHLAEGLAAVCQRHRWTTVQFHVAPLPNETLGVQRRGRHEWWVELRPGTAETPTGPIIAGELDIELTRRSDAYAQKRKGGQVDAPVVRLVMPGVFDRWIQDGGKCEGRDKVPACRPDREIANVLSSITRFAETRHPFPR
jgi:hypothetical protein